jgi:hypothetical protein
VEHFNNLIVKILMIVLVLCAGDVSAAGWEVGTKLGYDSNVNRAIGAEKSDSYLSGFLSYSRAPTGESRLDWIFGATIEGSVYNRFTDLSYGAVSIAPGLSYFLTRHVSAAVSPFLEAKAVNDSNQSALTGGVKVMLKEQITPATYLGQYYLYKTSSAKEDTYSFSENAVGIFVGTRLAKTITVEIGYEYATGDSYQALSSSPSSSSTGGGAHHTSNSSFSSGGRGSGGHNTFSRTFDQLIIKEDVDRNTVGINFNVGWSKLLSTTVGYTYTSMSGDSGTSESHSGVVNLGYSF